MKLHIIILLSVLVMFFCACGSSKKSGGSAGVSLIPGEAELKAIQTRYADVTMQTLNDGYAVFSGPCTKCHRLKKVSKRTEEEWQKSVNLMAKKAKISEIQKDALWKYILAIRAARPVPTK